jgi:hypothetical protein
VVVVESRARGEKNSLWRMKTGGVGTNNGVELLSKTPVIHLFHTNYKG